MTPWEPELDDQSARSALIAALAAILTPAVTRFLPPSWQIEPTWEVIDKWVEARRSAGMIGLVRCRERGDLVGLITLYSGDEQGDLRLGYLFAEERWGRGYASELVAGAVTWAREVGITRIIAGVERQNAASGAVLIKAGFERAGIGPDGVDEYQLLLGTKPD